MTDSRGCRLPDRANAAVMHDGGGARKQPGERRIVDVDHIGWQIARHLLYLASDESANLNGHALVVDWGGLATSTFPF